MMKMTGEGCRCQAPLGHLRVWAVEGGGGGITWTQDFTGKDVWDVLGFSESIPRK